MTILGYLAGLAAACGIALVLGCAAAGLCRLMLSIDADQRGPRA